MKSSFEPNVESPCPYAARVRELCLGKFDEALAEEVQGHLDNCASCLALVDRLAEPSEALLDSLSALPPLAEDEPAFQRLYAQLWASTPELAEASTAFVPLHLANPPIGPLPQRLGNYELLECVGRGAWGAVYRARHTKLEQIVAVKVLDSSRLHAERAVERFLQEMKAVGQLHHPNIVRATDAGEDRGFHYLVMEFVDGVDAGRLLHRRGRLDACDACEIVRQAAAALDFAHRRAWIHRDVKPSNLMVTREGVVKLLDLGIAGKHGGETRDELSASSGPPREAPLGTADYMPPEQWKDFAAVDRRADVYGLGCTLYRLLTSRLPYKGGPPLMIDGACPPIGAAELVAKDGIPRGLAKLLGRMLALDPAARLADAAEVARELTKWARRANLPLLVAEVRGGPPPPNDRGINRFTRRQLLAAGAAAGGSALLLSWAIRKPTPRLRRNIWRDLAPVAPMLVAVDPDARFHCDFQPSPRITVGSDELAIIHLGRSVSGVFSLTVDVRPESGSSVAGFFFQGHFPEQRPQEFEFQSLELWPDAANDRSATCRFEWGQWRLAEIDGRVSAQRDPWGSAEIGFHSQAVGRKLLVTLGQRGFPEVVVDGRRVAEGNWEFTAAGRRQVSRPPVQVQRRILGRIGLVNRRGKTEFHAPRLMYL